MDTNYLELSISIVTSNNKKLLGELLRSIYENTKKTHFEIIVVYNCSTDGSVEMIREHFPEVKSICHDSQKGYGYSHNRAWELSYGKYFLILNDDMYVLPDSLDIMIDTIKKDMTIGALGCRLLKSDNSIWPSHSTFPTLFRVIHQKLFFSKQIIAKTRIKSKLKYWNSDEERDVNIINGSCMLIPREVFEKVGFFDEKFLFYSEEGDLCKRIKQAGWRLHYTPKAKIIHYGGSTSKTMPVRMYVIGLESQIKYFKKHHGTIQANIVKAIYLLGIVLRLSGWFILYLLHLKNYQLAKDKLKLYRKAFLWFFGLYKT